MFETFKMIMDRLADSEDAWISFTRGNEYHIEIDDFDGFDENWNEIDREYVDPETVNTLFEFLNLAEFISDDYYRVYKFADFSVVVGFTSYDI